MIRVDQATPDRINLALSSLEKSLRREIVDAEIAAGAVTSYRVANGAGWDDGWKSELIRLDTTGAVTESTLYLLPASSRIEAVCWRVEEAIGTAVLFDLGDVSVSDRFTFLSGSASDMSAGAVGTGLPFDDITLSYTTIQPVDGKVRIALNATPSSGVVRLFVKYRLFVPPGS